MADHAAVFARARTELRATLAGAGGFATLAANARLTATEAEVLAVAAAGETMACAVRGVADELRKQGRLLKPSDFGEFAELFG